MKSIPKFIQSSIHLLSLCFCVFILIIIVSQPSVAQLFPDLNSSDEDFKAQSYIPVFYSGNLEIAPVFIDGREVGTVEAFRSLGAGNDSDQTNKYSASARSQVINRRSQKILDNMMRYTDEVLSSQGISDLATQERELRKQLVTSIAQKNGTWVVSIKFPQDDVPEIIYSVTQATIQRPRFGGSQPEKIAQRTANIIDEFLIQAWKERQFPYLQSASQQTLLILGVLIIISRSLAWVQKILLAKEQKFNQLLANINSLQSDSMDLGLSSDAEKLTEEMGQKQEIIEKNKLRNRKRINSFYKAGLFWTQWLMWVLGIGYIASLFYQTRPLSNWMMGVSVRNAWSQTRNPSLPLIDWLLSFGQKATVGTPLLILLLLLITRLTLKAGDAFSYTFARTSIENPSRPRHPLRVATLARVFRGWLRVIVYVLLGVIIASHLHKLGAITQLVAVLFGFISFALSLASQDFLKDLITGLLILWEDQYAVGDVIIVGDQGGLVENITLRVTQLRNLDGELITIPNRTISMVRNLSSEWSRVNYAIEVSYDTDVDRVLQVIEKVGQELYEDPQWQEPILEAPEILGVDEISHKGILIRLLIKTQPLQQWSVAREFRRRLKNVFDQQGIKVGIPQQKMYINDTSFNHDQPDFPLARLGKR
ncbi:MAG: mechanosensitive ion channel family protein [Crocosphaera sp.]